jgi:hypothetical protein
MDTEQSKSRKTRRLSSEKPEEDNEVTKRKEETWWDEGSLKVSKIRRTNQHQWLTPVTVTTHRTAIRRRIVVQNQTQRIVCKIL